MAFPSDIFLPSNAKYYAFVDSKLSYNPHYDINWSFEYALSGTQAGFCTFLTNFAPITGWPGQYLGYSGNIPISAYLITENGEYITAENGERIIVGNDSGIGNNGILAIAFDTTGLFALSSLSRGGVGLGSIRKNSLIIRNAYDEVITNVQLSSIDSNFSILSSGGFNYKTLRFRYAKAGNKLSIDYKNSTDSYYKLLTSIETELVIPEDFGNIYVGFCFCSPVSGILSPSTFKLRNFHTQGNCNDVNVEQGKFTPLTSII